jgi:hypothetical protein
MARTDTIPFAVELEQLDRSELINALMNFEGRARLDFTEEFLQRQSDGHLRHILLAAQMHLT